MPTIADCQRCTEPCPQAAMANEAAKGRMYATKEMISLLKKVESGQLVEVVRCGECKYFHNRTCKIRKGSWGEQLKVGYTDYCSDGERKDGDGND